MAAPKARPLLYAATTRQLERHGGTRTNVRLPTSRSAPNDMNALVSLAKTLMAYGVTDLVLDPGTFINEGLADTINNFTMLRRAATKGGEELAGFPLMGVPMVAWVDKGETAEDLLKWREAYLASMLIVRYADVLVMHGNKRLVTTTNNSASGKTFTLTHANPSQ